jgi:hypothetical protein
VAVDRELPVVSSDTWADVEEAGMGAVLDQLRRMSGIIAGSHLLAAAAALFWEARRRSRTRSAIWPARALDRPPARSWALTVALVSNEHAVGRDSEGFAVPMTYAGAGLQPGRGAAIYRRHPRTHRGGPA